MKALASIAAIALLVLPAAAQIAPSGTTPSQTGPTLLPADTPDAPKEIVLNTEAGHYDVRQIFDIGNANAIRAKLQFNAIHTDVRFQSRAQLDLLGDPYTLRDGYIELLFESLDNATFVASLSLWKNRVRTARVDLRTTVARIKFWQERPIDLEVDWTPDGSVTVKLDHRPMSLSMGQPVKRIQISNSSCDLIYSPFLLARTP